ncbi:MAG: CoA ester lyase [Myxococcota bacterium]
MDAPKEVAAGSLRRSLLFVPAIDRKKIEKSAGSGADTVLLDLEDSIAIDAKRDARENAARSLQGPDFEAAELVVRINPLASPYFEEDVSAVVAGGARCLMLPKCESADQLSEAVARIEAAERAAFEAHGGQGEAGVANPDVKQTVRILALVETARGVHSVVDVCASTDRIDGVCFGHVDFSSDMGLASPSVANPVGAHARASLVLGARARQKAAVDTVFLDVRDDEGLEAEAREAASMGFSGKLCIHPRQVAFVNRAFTPDEAAIEYARRILEARDDAEARGVGVFAVDGKMIDAPVIAIQERVMARARRAGVA